MVKLMSAGGKAVMNWMTGIYKGPGLLPVRLILAWSPGMFKRASGILWRVELHSVLSWLSGDLWCTFLLCHEISGIILLWEHSFWFPPLTCDAIAKYFWNVCDHILLQIWNALLDHRIVEVETSSHEMDTTLQKCFHKTSIFYVNVFIYLLGRTCNIFYLMSYIGCGKDTSIGSARTPGEWKLWSCFWEVSRHGCRLPRFFPRHSVLQRGYWVKQTVAVVENLLQPHSYMRCKKDPLAF